MKRSSNKLVLWNATAIAGYFFDAILAHSSKPIYMAARSFGNIGHGGGTVV